MGVNKISSGCSPCAALELPEGDAQSQPCIFWLLSELGIKSWAELILWLCHRHTWRDLKMLQMFRNTDS